MPPERSASASQGLAPAFAGRVVSWQRSHGRSELPWQNTRDPYRVWLSEVMLQQTQVSTVLGYFSRFLERFPSVGALARGTEDEVLSLWSGLGYYSRARNMHRCAQEVVERFVGEFPRTAAELQTLPGIGRSTAAAIAAFCFGERVAILDGNVKRVLTRVLAFDGDLASTARERELWNEATALLPDPVDPSAMPGYTQGLMDLGATICLPRRPSCIICPVADLCAARLAGTAEKYPVKTRKLRRTSHAHWLLLAGNHEGAVWLEKRPARGIWAGLYCLPVFESRDALAAQLTPDQRDTAVDGPAFLHVLTHKDLHLHPVKVACGSGRPEGASGAWYLPGEWQALGLPAPVRKLLANAGRA